MKDDVQSKIIFQKRDNIGVNDAEDDTKFLIKCFVDNGDFGLMSDYSNPKCLLLGRTGIGKTALISKLKTDKGDRVIIINPEALAMQHITNSTIIRYMHELNLDLNLFFKLLWRHSICVEVFQHHFKSTTAIEIEEHLTWLKHRFRREEPKYYRAFQYLQEWKGNFWKDSDSYVTEMLSKKESELKGSIGISDKATLKASKRATQSTQEKTETKKRLQEIVNGVQIREVTNLLDMLNEAIEGKQKKYYIVIDKLDEGWVDDDIRYHLIKALIETVRDLNRLENIKPIVALRIDLLGQVFDLTQDTGFQEEKYSSLYLNITWSREQLTTLIDLRIDYLLKSRYSQKTPITHLNILPEDIDGQPTIDYIIDRTLMRPRDIIDFFNIYIDEVVDKGGVSKEAVLDAEKLYSRGRVNSLSFEWFAEFPNIKFWLNILRDRKSSLFVSDFEDESLKYNCVEYLVEESKSKRRRETDELLLISQRVIDETISIKVFRKRLISILYLTGAIGIQLENENKPLWSYDLRGALPPEDITLKTKVFIHPCFYGALNTKTS